MNVPGMRRYGLALATGAVLVLALATAIGVSARGWIGKPFPGFFVLTNGVVASIGRAAWPSSEGGAPYQAVVDTVDGVHVRGSADVYRRVASRSIGSSVEYSFRDGSATVVRHYRVRRFTHGDYLAIFGGYFASGVLYLLLALLAAWRLPGNHLGRALLAVGGLGGFYALSAVWIYAPGAGLRAHAVIEACFPAAFVYLALVFPVERRCLLAPGVAFAAWLSCALAIAYVLLIDRPAAYSIIHAACESYLGVAGFGFMASLLAARVEPGGRLRLLSAAAAGGVMGLGVPAVIFTLSGLSGGRLPVNVTTATAFLFPLCFGYGLACDALGLSRSGRAAPPAHGLAGNEDSALLTV